MNNKDTDSTDTPVPTEAGQVASSEAKGIKVEHGPKSPKGIAFTGYMKRLIAQWMDAHPHGPNSPITKVKNKEGVDEHHWVNRSIRRRYKAIMQHHYKHLQHKTPIFQETIPGAQRKLIRRAAKKLKEEKRQLGIRAAKEKRRLHREKQEAMAKS